MPIYEYVCLKCESGFELFVRGETRIACPKCNGTRVERTMSLPARPGGGNSSPDFSPVGPPKGGGCGGGGCGCH